MRLAVRGFVRVSAKSVFLVVLRRASSPRSPTRTGLLAGGGWTITSKHAGGCWAPTGAVPACLLRRPRSSRCGSRRAAPARRGGCRYAKLIEALYVSLGPATPRSDNPPAHRRPPHHPPGASETPQHTPYPPKRAQNHLCFGARGFPSRIPPCPPWAKSLCVGGAVARAGLRAPPNRRHPAQALPRRLASPGRFGTVQQR